MYFTPKEMEPVWSPAGGVPAQVPGRPRRPGRQGCSQCLSLQGARPEVRHKHKSDLTRPLNFAARYRALTVTHG